jgi:hypothetical protein
VTDAAPKETFMEAILQQLYERKAKLERELGGVTLAITAIEEAFDLQPLNLAVQLLR